MTRLQGDQLDHVDEQTVRSFQVGNFRRQIFDHDRGSESTRSTEYIGSRGWSEEWQWARRYIACAETDIFS